MLNRWQTIGACTLRALTALPRLWGGSRRLHRDWAGWRRTGAAHIVGNEAPICASQL